MSSVPKDVSDSLAAIAAREDSKCYVCRRDQGLSRLTKQVQSCGWVRNDVTDTTIYLCDAHASKLYRILSDK